MRKSDYDDLISDKIQGIILRLHYNPYINGKSFNYTYEIEVGKSWFEQSLYRWVGGGIYGKMGDVLQVIECKFVREFGIRLSNLRCSQIFSVSKGSYPITSFAKPCCWTNPSPPSIPTCAPPPRRRGFQRTEAI